ncbi:MAG: HAMP domain-containing histidine kinase, partial [Pirellulales bacterium]|nr:HAMP domain-containing histidine kinase [Pirellulales bacterium]
PRDDVAEMDAQLAEKLARLERLEAHFAEELQKAKLDSLKELAYGAGHELNNPLANISTRAQVLLRDEEDPERRRKLAAINAQAFRGHEMIADLMLYARPPKMVLANVELDALVARIVDESRSLAEERQVEIFYRSDIRNLSANADEHQVFVALTAIIKNAVEVLGVGGRIDVDLTHSSPHALREVTHQSDAESHHAERDGYTEGDAALIRIRDNGPGIEPHILPRIFDPFFSGREAGRGLGFGLSKAWRIITDHGGSIAVESEPGHGATFVVRLPVESHETQGTDQPVDAE